MQSLELYDEIRVVDGVAERTGAQFERSAVRRSRGCCRSMTELSRKARSSGDGDFYLPHELWPPDSEQVDLRKPWIILSSLPEPRASDEQ